MGNVVAIVGRPNVGKSTLFNRLTGERKAIVDDESGVTRDRHYGIVEWTGHEFTLIDTGGYVVGSDDVFEAAIRNQVVIAMEEADLLIFMVDVSDGLTALDSEFAKVLRRSSKPVILAINKVDNSSRQQDALEFYALGYEKMYNLSSITGSGTGELLDTIVKNLPEQEEEEVSDLPKIAIIGRPNVGKSSLVNALLGEDRNIVTDIPGTTRDAIHSHYNAFGNEFKLIDTAGIRKKGKVREDIEFYSVMRSVRVIELADICVLLIDATQGLEAQDLNLFFLAKRNNKGVVILVNKWDLIEKDHTTAKAYEQQVKEKIAPFVDVPILFISVLNKQRIHKSVEVMLQVYKNRQKRISTSALNEVMLPIIAETPPPSIKGKYVRIKYVTQLPGKAPAFAFFCNLPQYIKEPYKRFLENQLRAHFDFNGVPVRIFLRKK